MKAGKSTKKKRGETQGEREKEERKRRRRERGKAEEGGKVEEEEKGEGRETERERREREGERKDEYTHMIGRIDFSRPRRVTKASKIRNYSNSRATISDSSNTSFRLSQENHFIEIFENFTTGLMDSASKRKRKKRRVISKWQRKERRQKGEINTTLPRFYEYERVFSIKESHCSRRTLVNDEEGSGMNFFLYFLEEEESRPEVGSSRNNKSGSFNISIPILNLLDSPPLIPLLLLSPTLELDACVNDNAFIK